MAKNQLIVAVDFDGTCVMHDYPRIGDDVLGAVEVLKAIVESSGRLILYTMRHGETLEAAVNWFRERDIPLWAVNENPGQKHWTQSPKVYATHYIDDASVGCPLIHPEGGRPYVDWEKVGSYFAGVIKMLQV